jgi:hypothetical protein
MPLPFRFPHQKSIRVSFIQHRYMQHAPSVRPMCLGLITKTTNSEHLKSLSQRNMLFSSFSHIFPHMTTIFLRHSQPVIFSQCEWQDGQLALRAAPITAPIGIQGCSHNSYFSFRNVFILLTLPTSRSQPTAFHCHLCASAALSPFPQGLTSNVCSQGPPN